MSFDQLSQLSLGALALLVAIGALGLAREVVAWRRSKRSERPPKDRGDA